ncbi:MAG: Preprotein translocase, SecG subunit [Candidatus Gottesmanbacteria bacterium GW2011_GWA2_47_9]|uniref:Protein-export membrane protein SecG n=2 Tax=Candidatus Gottesmaniibacteriota TaxID=1752720 RepID=A0A0G1UN73_9BACT|nr:MAG: Preprotein translocase, SecG subunit [Candidatus Gottesmanbacteria bacterium GW2011_GWA2_47_9]KKU95561.1 MAG: Preprotein translocase, SecG subunit [Candidatus Gottesmanbacteria bacterium GW2011_GWA1_48_13]
MKSALLVFHILISVTLIALILLQNSKGGLGGAFGGADAFRTRRGAEKVVFTATIVAAVLFLATSVANLLIQ